MKKRVVFLILLFCIFFSVKKVNASTLITPTYNSSETIVADYILEPSSNKTTDRTADIKKMLNYCSSANGGTLYLKAGVYRVSGTITIPRGCTLRGDWQDPDVSGTKSYGTIISVSSSTNYDSTDLENTGLFRMSSNSGVVGLTIYYEGQKWNISTFKDHAWTFFYGHGELDGKNITIDSSGNMASGSNPLYRPTMYTIKNITLINSYRGIGKSVKNNMPHEMLYIENVKGTALYKGVTIHNSSDVGTIINLKLNPSYWVNANESAIGTSDTMPSESNVVSFINTISGMGLYLTDAEMHQMANITLSGYKYGIFIPGTWNVNNEGVKRRSMGSGIIYNLNISNCDYGIYAGDNYFIHHGTGYQITHSSISGSTYSIYTDTLANPSNSNVHPVIKLQDVKLSGKTGGSGVVIYYDTSSKTYKKLTLGSSIPNSLNSVSSISNIYLDRPTKTYGTKYVEVSAGSNADTIQAAINTAYNAGGGVVYLKPGLYNVNKQIIVKENVELRGSFSVLSRQAGKPGTSNTLGTVINIDPVAIGTNYSSTIELAENNSGVSGIVFTYSKNISSMQANNNFTISAPAIGTHNSKGVYITNVSIMGATIGIGVDSSEDFTISNVSSTTFSNFVLIKNSKNGLIKNTLHNSTVLSLNSYYSFNEGYFINLLNKSLSSLDYITLENSDNIEGINNFAYAPRNLFVVKDSTGYFLNNGNDSFPDLANSQSHVVFNIYNSTKSKIQFVNTYYYIGNSGTLTNNYNSSNVVNTINSLKLITGASNDNHKYETDKISSSISPLASSSLRVYNTSVVKANSGLVYNDGKNLVTSSVASGSTIYYSTSVSLTSSNYSSKGSTTIPKNSSINAGTIKVYYYIPSTSKYYEKSGTVSVSVGKKSTTMSLSANSGTLTYGTNGTITITTNSNGTLSCSSDTTSVVKCSISGKTVTLTPQANTADSKTAKVTISQAASTNYNAASKVYTATVNRKVLACPKSPSDKTYNGTTQTSGITCPSNSTISGTGSGKNAGTFTQTCTPAAGYKFSSACTVIWKINKRSITVTATDQSKNWDGKALSANNTCSVTSGSLVDQQIITCTASGSQTNAGSSNKTLTSAVVKNGAGTDISPNYNITKINGKLTVNKVAATITCANKTYNGSLQTIATCSGGEIINASKTSVGIYTVSCTGDSNHTNAANKSCSISKKKASLPTLTAYTGTYDGKGHTATIGSSNEGTVKYSIDQSNWSTTKPERINVGTSTVYVKVVGDSNHSDSDVGSVKITINKAKASTVSVKSYSGIYDGKAHTIIVGTTSEGTIKYSTNQNSWSTTKPERTNIGKTTVYVKVVGDSNHSDSDVVSTTINIIENSVMKKTITYNSNNGKNDTYTQVFTIGFDTKLDRNTFTYSGYKFKNWNTKADGSGASYKNEQVINKTSDITLYAIWEEITDFAINDYEVDEVNNYICKVSVNTEISKFKKSIVLMDGYDSIIEYKDVDNKKVLYTGGKTKIMKGTNVYKEYTNVVMGDVNGDGAINSADLLKIRQHLLGTKKLSGTYFLSSDINYDNTINSADLLRERQHLLGIKEIK